MTIAGVTPATLDGNFIITSVISATKVSRLPPAIPMETNSTTPATFVDDMVTINTNALPHNFSVGQSVVIAGVGVAGYNGTFTIAAVPSATSFTYDDSSVSVAGLAASGGGTATDATNNIVTITTSAAHNLNVGQTVTIENVGVAGYNVTATVLSVPSATTFTYADTNLNLATSGGGDATNNLVTITTAAAHGFTAGQTVTVAGAGLDNYNGTFTIAGTPASTTFTYVDPAVGFIAASGSGAATISSSGTFTAQLPNSLDDQQTLNFT